MVNRHRIRSFIKRHDMVEGQEFEQRELAHAKAMIKLERIFQAVEKGNWHLPKQRVQDESSLPGIAFYSMNVAAGIKDAESIRLFSLSEPVAKPNFMSDDVWVKFREEAICRESVMTGFMRSLGTRRFLDVFRHHFHTETGFDHRSELVRDTSRLVHEEITRCKIAGVQNRITELGWPVLQAMTWTTLMTTMIGRDDVLENALFMYPLLEFGIPVATIKGNPKAWVFITG